MTRHRTTGVARAAKLQSNQKKKLSQDCNATLRINGEEFDGATGRDKGHAEMDALDQFIEARATDAAPTVAKCVEQAVAILKKPGVHKTVVCPSRPVCRKCTAVLKGLGFKRGSRTDWGDKNAGSTEWGASLKVRDLLKAYGLDYENIRIGKL